MTLPTHFTLNTGTKIPAVGFGTWQAAPHEVEEAVEIALRAGYRHIDGAAVYRNETEVGQGIRKSGVPRSDIFLTGKLWNNKHAPEDVEKALDKSLGDLGTDYLDLYLMHWPVSFRSGDNMFPLKESGSFDIANIPLEDTYRAMETLLDTGKVKAIGVSNFTINRLKDLMSKTTIIPAVNQVEAHPYLQQRELLSFCQSRGILIQAYSPLGNNIINEPRTVDDPLVDAMSKRLGVDGGQLLASWGIQRGTVVLPKSVTPKRIESNLQVKELPQDAYEEITALERHKRFNWTKWGVDIFRELGDDRARRIGEEAAPENLRKFGV